MPHLSRCFLLAASLLLTAFAPPPAPVAVATVYVFLAPTCPISQAVTPTLRTLASTYAVQGVRFVGVIPDEKVTAAERAAFGRDYRLPFPLEPDPAQALARRLGATITPEAVVVTADGQIAYRGRIDDGFARLGVRRAVVQHHELADALAAVVAERPVAVARAAAVGCFIEFGGGRRGAD